ncbi:3-oxoacyl-[acyl-carrier protein] reductase [Saccharopolyspora erythraea NRRL 2338]|uniref:3-ketoacyl-(Acyl-carrier-protein) reductase n=2 Tax=Saccharopolyspora erythraea TaxID=1836 RepID=A4FFY0_SACEN|nr:SDR family oxidoreductase [Saccharopolyspora erythraea]EQD84033.1 3-ketoacyl-ACP reductase [Saccharopolyspora erythraea D]PFG96661.1 3-oxoacyl-[acyl-carrier protein] reductase [Saccharopolyspora erythraea NRRL 2338]QRK93141.1 SDR family oxidoreductase [Saccharopolyspora erythraea]CAM02955.1 3-ketoacyl-(acyl-carrier-protein) reductase [Saccharopolyspora erythraea NRRL 2338]
MIDPRLHGRVALVTGANSPLGIGAAIAAALARQGVRLLLTAVPETPPRHPGSAAARTYAEAKATDGSQVRDALRADGAHVEFRTADLADPEALPRLFDHAEAAFGSVEILVNNAAHCVPDTFDTRSRDTVDAASIDAHHAVNTRAPALLIAEMHRRHLRRGGDWGRVINISTDAAPGAPGQISYWASKHALESLSRSAALELGPAGITVNSIAPGPVQTGWIDQAMDTEFAAFSPLGRVGTPADIADIAVFLASHQGRWITGQTLLAGGGKRLF